MPQALQDELFEALNRGIDILDSEPQMTAYLFAFGKMHQAKLNYAFGKLPKEFFEQPEINIIDYGCGQALGTMCYADYLRDNGYVQNVKTITLIEPSEICLKRAALHASVFFPDAAIKTVNKKFDDLTQNDIVCCEETPTLHILSNVLDMLNFNLERFAELVKGCLKGYNQFVCVGPYFKYSIKDERMAKFRNLIQVKKYFFKTFDKHEFVKDKDWTAQFLCFSIGEFAQNTQMKQQDLILVGEFTLEEYKAKFNNSKLNIIDNPKRPGSWFFSCGILPNGQPNYGAVGQKAKVLIEQHSDSSKLRVCVYRTHNQVGQIVELPILQANNNVSIEECDGKWLDVQISTVVSDEDLKNGVENEFGVIYSIDGKRLLKCENKGIIKYVINEGTRVICDRAFELCESLRQVILPKSVINIGYEAFRKCESLQLVNIPKSVINIGDSAFSKCKSLQRIAVPDSVTRIGRAAFFRCNSLEQIRLPNSVTRIENETFFACLSLEQITIPNSVISIAHSAFKNCKSLQQIIIPENSVEKFKQLLSAELWDKLYYLKVVEENAEDEYDDRPF